MYELHSYIFAPFRTFSHFCKLGLLHSLPTGTEGGWAEAGSSKSFPMKRCGIGKLSPYAMVVCFKLRYDRRHISYAVLEIRACSSKLRNVQSIEVLPCSGVDVVVCLHLGNPNISIGTHTEAGGVQYYCITVFFINCVVA